MDQEDEHGIHSPQALNIDPELFISFPMPQSFSAKSALSEIRSSFQLTANPELAPAMKAYMKQIADYFGIPAPQRRIIQKEIISHWKFVPLPELSPLLELLLAQPERELHYLAMEWLYQRKKEYKPDTIQLIEHFLTTTSWWDTVDFIAARILGTWAEKYPKEAKPIIRKYIKSPNFWLNRSAMLHQLFYRDKTDKDLLEDCILPHISNKEFFLRKAIGWCLRSYAASNPEWVREFVNTHELSPLSRKEALKHLS